MKKIKILTLIISLLQIGKSAYATSMLTLQEAIEIGMENNMRIYTAQDAVKKSKYKRTPKIFIPNINIGLGNNFIYEDKNKNFKSAQVLTFSLPIDPLKKYFEYQRATKQLSLDSSKLDEAVLKHIREIAKLYYNLVFEQQKLNVIKRSLEISQENKTHIKRLYDLGRESKTRYTTTLIQYNNDASAYAAQEEVVANTKANLCILIGKKIENDFIVQASINVHDIPKNHLIENQDCPEISTKEKAINLAEVQKKITWSKVLPSVSASVGYKFNEKSNDWKKKTSVTLTVSINIYDLLVLNNELQCANIDLDNAIKDMGINKNHLAIQTKLALAKYETQKFNYSLEKENLDLSIENFLEMQQQYNLGKIAYLEYRDAKKNMETAELNFFKKAYETKLAEIDIYFCLGKKDLLMQACIND